MTEEKNLTLERRLLLAQQALKAPKGQYNSFGDYRYRSAEDILEALKPVLASFGLTLYLSDDLELVGDWHYIKATATITDGERSISVKAFAREQLTKKKVDESQLTGTASSYARKYALNGLFLIDDNKDADTDEYQKQQQHAPQQAPAHLQPTESDFKADYKKYANNVIQLTGATMEQVTEWVSQRVGHPANEFPQHQQAVIGAVLGILKEAQNYKKPVEPNAELAQQRQARVQAKPQGQQGYNHPFAK